MKVTIFVFLISLETNICDKLWSLVNVVFLYSSCFLVSLETGWIENVLNWALIKIFVQCEPLVAKDLVFIQWLSLGKDLRVSVVDCEIEVSFTWNCSWCIFFLFLGLGKCEKRLGRNYMFHFNLEHLYLHGTFTVRLRLYI